MPSKELIVSQTPHETKVGILEDGQLVEVFFQRANEYSLAGSIHKGRVTRVLPGMQSAFVDLGLERDTFLYVSDFFEENGDDVERIDDQPPQAPRRGRGRDRDRDRDRERDQERPAEAREAAPVPAAENGASAATDSAAAPQTDEQRDRRGRRSRRRRRGGKGFPDSKYASAEQAAEPEEETGEAGAEGVDEPVADVAEEEVAPIATPVSIPVATAPASVNDSEFLVLPGESLAKYRRAVASPVEATPEIAAAQPETTMPDSVVEAAADDVVEQILDRVEAIEQAEIAAATPEPEAASVETVAVEIAEAEEPESAVEPEAEPVAAASATTEAQVEEEAAPADEAEAVAKALEAEEVAEAAVDESIAEVSADEVETAQAAVPAEDATRTDEAGETIAQAVEDDGSPEPARTPQSLTATLRAQGGRAGHRMSRRMRRRGRGGQPQDAQAQEAQPQDEASPETVEVRAEAVAEPVEARPAVPEPRAEKAERPERERQERAPLPSISDLLKEGQEIIVQIAKEPLGQKGARITSHIALPGRYVVYMPTVDHFGVSRKISTDEERQRLKKILQKHKEGVPGGYIMRTAGEGRTEDEIAADMNFLAQLWQDIKNKADKRRAPALLHHDVEIVERIMRDQLTDGFKAVWVDNEDLYEQVLHSTERLAPSLLSRIKLYTRPEPIFDAFGITQELEKALRPKVWLKSGGYIVINQTEALVAIDVNTGKYVGKSNRLEDTIVKTNTEAVKEIVRQMRLRDLGGIIVVDFIDMDERKNRQKVMQALEDAMKADKAPYKILQFNDFGLVAITRKRVKQSLERTLCAPCPHCEGAGYVKSVQTVIGEILAQAQKYAKVVDGKDCLLRVNPDVAKVLKSVENKYLEELEEVLGRPVLVTSDALLHQEKFDLT